MVKQRLHADGMDWLFTCVSMGNPHAVTFGFADGTTVQVRGSRGKWGL